MMFPYNSPESLCVMNPSSTYVIDVLKCPQQTCNPHLLYLEEFNIWSSTSLNCPEHSSPWNSVKLQPIKHCAVVFHGIRILFYFIYVSSLISVWQSSFESMSPSKKVLSVIPTGIVHFEKKRQTDFMRLLINTWKIKLIVKIISQFLQQLNNIADIPSENVLRIYRSDDVSDKLTISTVTNILNYRWISLTISYDSAPGAELGAFFFKCNTVLSTI